MGQDLRYGYLCYQHWYGNGALKGNSFPFHICWFFTFRVTFISFLLSTIQNVLEDLCYMRLERGLEQFLQIIFTWVLCGIFPVHHQKIEHICLYIKPSIFITLATTEVFCFIKNELYTFCTCVVYWSNWLFSMDPSSPLIIWGLTLCRKLSVCELAVGHGRISESQRYTWKFMINGREYFNQWREWGVIEARAVVRMATV